jgi:hypothetical protein
LLAEVAGDVQITQELARVISSFFFCDGMFWRREDEGMKKMKKGRIGVATGGTKDVISR